MELEELLIKLSGFLQLLQNIFTRDRTNKIHNYHNYYLDTSVQKNQSALSTILKIIHKVNATEHITMNEVQIQISIPEDFTIIREWFVSHTTAVGFFLDMRPLEQNQYQQDMFARGV